MICKHILNQPELICLDSVEWFQVLRCKSNNLASVICLHSFQYDLLVILFLDE